MKKLFTFLLSCIAVSMISVPASAEQSSDAETEKNVFIQKTICATAGYEIFGEDEDSAVTRGEFTSAVVHLFKKNVSSGEESQFSDVNEDYKYADEINSAAAIGIVSEADMFYPDNPIKINEALKIIMQASGYSFYAELNGGYPGGYIWVAGSYNFLDNVNVGEADTLKAADAYNLIYNAMTADIVTKSFTGSNVEYSRADEDYFSYLYGLYKDEGIVTSTGYSSVTMTTDVNPGYIGINGDNYSCNNIDPDLLGMNVIYYASKDDKNIISVSAYRNKEISVSCEDIVSVSNGKIKYYDNSHTKNENIDKSFTTIYNGRAVSVFDEKYLDLNCGSLRLVDNDSDGSYDIIFIDKVQYRKVESVDVVENSLGLDNSLFIDFDKVEYSEIIDQNGESLELYELNTGDTAAIRISEDGKLVKVNICSEIVSGLVTSVSDLENSLDLGEEGYRYSAEIKEKYIDTGAVRAGSSITAVLGLNGELAFIENVRNTLEYGYFIKLNSVETDIETDVGVLIRLYTASGEHKNFRIAEKVLIDGVSKKEIDAFKAFQGYSDGCLIRYECNQSGEISKLDFPESFDQQTMTLETEFDNNDKLICFKDKSAMIYRSASKAFPPFCSVTKANIFYIPKDKNAKDDYSVIPYTELYDNESYTMSVYNIDGEGKAEAIVIYEGSNSSTFAQAYDSFIVEQITEAVNDDGDLGLNVYGWCNGEFKTVFISEDIEIKKTSGEPLTSGDIIRMRESNGKVLEVYVDYDCSSGEPVADTIGGGRWDLPLGNGYCSYHDGGVYRYGSDTVYFSSKKIADTEEYDFSFENLNVYSNSAAIVCYNTQRKKLRTISSSEIKGYVGYGSDCHRIILRQSYSRPKAIFIIE